MTQTTDRCFLRRLVMFIGTGSQIFPSTPPNVNSPLHRKDAQVGTLSLNNTTWAKLFFFPAGNDVLLPMYIMIPVLILILIVVYVMFFR